MIKGRLGDVEFQFTPAEFTWGREIEYQEVPILGMETAPLDYVGGKGRTAPLELFLDGDSVEDDIKTLIGYAEKESGSNAPPVVTLEFANLTIDCVVKSYSITNKRVDRESGKVNRAVITVILQEWVESETHRTTREQKGERIYITKIAREPVAAETFRNIAWREFDDPDLAQAISDFNPDVLIQCSGPAIPAGITIRIPPWSFAKQYLPEVSTGIIEY